MEVFFLFLLALAVGSLTTLYWIPEPDLGRGYFQLNSLVILGLLGLATAVYYLHPFQPFGDRSALGTAGLVGGLAATSNEIAAPVRASDRGQRATRQRSRQIAP